ncbi:MAG: capsular biosynthesis protein [Bacteroidia bacterium]|nr:capsular biosynthesis protein [Bacteroidia bacterium]
MGLFSGLFRKPEKIEPIDLGLIGVDMHSHFIPGIDDGAKTLNDSLEMLRTMQELGYRKVITTPHIMGDFYRNTPEIINSGLDKLKEAAAASGITIGIEAAAEYYFDYELEDKIDKGNMLTFGKNYLLFEVSYMNAPDGLDGIIFKLQTHGYIPVLAHPERYPYWFRDMSNFEKLKDKGVLFQLNINSLTGYYSPATLKIAEQMIDKGWYEFAGTDCHHSGHLGLLQKARTSVHLKKLIESGKLLNSAC